MVMSLSEIEAELYRLVKHAQEKGILLRLVGGMAVRLHSPSAHQPQHQRASSDLDFITTRVGGQKLASFFEEMGYLPDQRLNTLNGDRRQVYFQEDGSTQVDIFVEVFEMCHRLPMNGRLDMEPVTVPLAELFLTKAQIVQLNHKDVMDMIWLLADHDVGNDDQETINLQKIARYCADDWGLYTTVSMNLEKITQMIELGEIELESEIRSVVVDRIFAIRKAMDSIEKNLAWKLRAKIGKRMRWYEEVEEVER